MKAAMKALVAVVLLAVLVAVAGCDDSGGHRRDGRGRHNSHRDR